jgi:hypothetical protein
MNNTTKATARVVSIQDSLVSIETLAGSEQPLTKNEVVYTLLSSTNKVLAFAIHAKRWLKEKSSICQFLRIKGTTCPYPQRSLFVGASSLWDVKNKPVSRLRLDRRLTLLNDQDRQQLAAIEKILHWAKMSAGNNDVEISVAAERVLQSLDKPLLQQVIIWRLELRLLQLAG